MSQNEFLLQQKINKQQQNQYLKNLIVNVSELTLEAIYKNCTEKCILKQLKSPDLSDQEKVCLNKCFIQKQGSLQQVITEQARFREALENQK
ncbi:Tim10/DDP family zinc finger protein (macronuclear) [Tetrahymena thermophila SB210]|uniref:Tim10/DDP family zinc finger protein n=1 Tax=Tetrahymena thermophila (strain SB210) TaxID=312017 RepID=W7XBT4_TETTS|nr:Tim10/DDP family zinc finger protein [Tetrahymena thermophila SB210]EWS73883.1 Tim10/DDP family zinc finger protein [Tetrahymena thermophila SB210]|eukprot:XP_012653630.1 Tim10/DDP family zinc finger protein [Tetrahymena thermophila SB210]